MSGLRDEEINAIAECLIDRDKCSSDPTPVEGVVLPEFDARGHGYNTGCECDLVGGDPACKIQPPYESPLAQRERQLAEAIAQRDAAQKDVFRFCTGHGIEDFVSLRDRAAKAEAALATERAKVLAIQKEK